MHQDFGLQQADLLQILIRNRDHPTPPAIRTLTVTATARLALLGRHIPRARAILGLTTRHRHHRRLKILRR